MGTASDVIIVIICNTILSNKVTHRETHKWDFLAILFDSLLSLLSLEGNITCIKAVPFHN